MMIGFCPLLLERLGFIFCDSQAEENTHTYRASEKERERERERERETTIP
jgi:hypothetical protein